MESQSKSWSVTPGVGKNRKKALGPVLLFIIAAVAFGLSRLFDVESVLGGAFNLLFVIVVLMAIIATIRSRRSPRKT